MANFLQMLAEMLSGQGGVAPVAAGPVNRLTNLGGMDTPAGGGALDAVGQRIMQQQLNPYMGGAAPVNAQPAPSAAPVVDNVQTASTPSPAPSGGGIGGFVQNLFGGGNEKGYNETVQWLQRKGYDAGAAQMIAKDKPTLQKVLLTYGSPQEVDEYTKRATAALRLGLKQGSPEFTNFVAGRDIIKDDEQAKPTDDMREYQESVRQGYKGSLVDWMKEMKRAGANVNNGTIPAGYQAVYGPNQELLRYDPVPGGPADQERQAADAKAGVRDNQTAITSDTVVSAAKQAREAVDGGFLPTTGTIGNFIGGTIGESNAAEVMRQTETLKAIAAAENINAMRQASPTGGALGNASDADIALLKNKAGALDPTAGAARYKAALDDYERTLLRIVHGYEAGDRIFEATRTKNNGASGKRDRVATPERFGGTPQKTQTGVPWSIEE